ncbi:MAG: DUF1549 domain-containing protein [Planctomycetia bacterium]|nr:DUF1549 domain-containing protein [Planctomycetia bacterium]
MSLGKSLLIASSLLAMWCLAVAAPAPPATGQEKSPPAENKSAADKTAPAVAPAASDDQSVVNYIDALIRKGWEENGVTPSPMASDGEWLRRLYLDVLGRIPTVEETKAFAADRSQDKRRKLVQKLLYSDEYVEEYARNFTTIWTNILIGRTGGTDPRRPVSRLGLQQYLRRSFLKNKPYDEMVVDLISANGSNTPGEEDYNGAVNFLLDNLDENATPATAKVARYFLGVQVQCTQCHNHPFNDWKQDRFWEMNAFFRQMKALRTREGRQIVSAKLEDEDFAGEGNDPKEAEIYYELRNGLLKVAYPVFIDGTKIDPAGYVDEVNRRDELAKLVRKSPQLGQAMVNRTWGHFLGYGFTKPIDDMGPHNSPTHPELLERLGKDFATYGYDVRKLITWITLSQPYALSSKMHNENKKDDPLLGEKPLFSHFYMRQMTAEQLYESLIVATQADKSARGTYEEQERQKTEWLQQFSVAFGTDENDEATTFNGTIPQTLMMWNGDLIRQAVNGGKGTLLYNVAASNLKPGQKVEYLYMSALTRAPSSDEKRMADVAWASRKGNAYEAMQDVFWVILNSNEFILIH